MDSLNVYDFYDSFSNLFELKTEEEGKIYKCDRTIDYSKRFYYQNQRFTYEKMTEIVEGIEPNIHQLKRVFTKRFVTELKEAGSKMKGKYTVYHPDKQIDHAEQSIFHIYDGFDFRVVSFKEDLCLGIDPHLVFKMTASVQELLSNGLPRDFLPYKPIRIFGSDRNINGMILDLEEGEGSSINIRNFREQTESTIHADRVYFEARPELIEKIIRSLGRNLDVTGLQRKHSFLDSNTASKDRLQKTLNIAHRLKDKIFPVEFGDFKINLNKQPVIVKV
ncbi:MAG: hypothetical protein ACOC85_05705 [Thermoplasmatota archaeon]